MKWCVCVCVCGDSDVCASLCSCQSSSAQVHTVQGLLTEGERSTHVFCCAFFVTIVLLSNYCTHAHFCHSFAHACNTALKTKAAALLTMALAITILPAKALIWRS